MAKWILDYDEYYEDDDYNGDDVTDSECRLFDIFLGLTIGFGVATLLIGKLHRKNALSEKLNILF